MLRPVFYLIRGQFLAQKTPNLFPCAIGCFVRTPVADIFLYDPFVQLFSKMNVVLFLEAFDGLPFFVGDGLCHPLLGGTFAKELSMALAEALALGGSGGEDFFDFRCD